jgi:cell volume regulation protein A
MDPVTLALILAGGIIAIGFLGNYLFERTGFPDMILLLVLGIIIGPLTGLVNAGAVMPLAPYLAALALVFILFDGGMVMNIYHVFLKVQGLLFSLSLVLGLTLLLQRFLWLILFFVIYRFFTHCFLERFWVGAAVLW